jgi:hypothetical protein
MSDSTKSVRPLSALLTDEEVNRVLLRLRGNRGKIKTLQPLKL